MESLSSCFLTEDQQVVSVIGSGGKTSLIKELATTCSNQEILITTTTKIGYPKRAEYDILYYNQRKINPPIKKGINILGDKFLAKDGTLKLAQAKDLKLQKLTALFKKIFIEADGSKQLPLKGWAGYEPVVLDETTETIAVIPIKAIGKKINSDIIHRLPLFLALTGEQEEDEISLSTLIKIIQNPKGLFAKAKGIRILFINQVDTSKEAVLAKKIAEILIKEQFPIDKIVAGSAQNGRGVILWQR